ncbi:hypothetical protein M407DRAFT_242395 [Tulasnella calospora MUT 4182]|uniref:Uncharacterized protein n=1 Tax=Tulasnella calospora MUT 4182 TaxID=1051891 RepID=A0A0C3QP95_9AGAM|nr:hypothetical protein M407DRAFT_242395 [Tulasnella calospora MUT 4182]
MRVRGGTSGRDEAWVSRSLIAGPSLAVVVGGSVTGKISFPFPFKDDGCCGEEISGMPRDR